MSPHSSDNILHEIAQAISPASGEEFFRRLAEALCQTLEVDFAFIGRVDADDPNCIHVMGVHIRSKIAENFSYHLHGTPCENVVGREPCHYPRDIQSLFPEDHMLVEMGIESYIGHPLFGSTQQPLGLLAVMHSQPMPDEEPAKSVLQICASRAATEIERIQAEETLRASEANLRSLAENAGEGILVNMDGRHVFANRRIAEMLGYRVEELLQTTIKDIVHPDEQDRVTEMFRKRMTGHHVPNQYETVFVAKDGKRVPMEISAATTVWQGKPAGLVFLRDITDRKQAEAETRKLSSAIEQTADIVTITDCDGIIQYVNLAYEETTGFSREETLGKKPNIVKSGKHDPAFYRRLWGTIRSGQAFHDVFINRKKNGELYHEEKTITPLKDENGNITHFVSTGKDITERRKTEDTIARLGRILDNSSNEVYVFCADSLRFMQVNHGARQNLGYTLEELKALTPLDLKPEFTKHEFEALVAPLRRGERDTVMFETVHKRKDGSLYPVEARLQLSRNETPPVFFAIIQDITERKKAYAALRMSEERFRSLTELSSDWYWEQNADFRFTLVTRNENTDVRFAEEETLGKKRWELPYLDVPPAFWKAHEALLQAHRPFRDLVLKRKNDKGNIRFSSISGVPIFDAQGRFQGYRGTGRDITERKLAEEEIQMKARLLDNSSESIFVIDLEGKILYANETAWKSRGYTRDELMKLDLRTIDTPEHAKLIPSRMREVLEKGQLTFVSAHYRKDGSVMPIEISACVFDWGGKKVFLSAMRDITERVREDEARHSTLEALHALHAITANTKLSFGGKIRKLLAMGCRRFNLPIGILAHAENNCYEVMEVVAPDDSIAKGSVYPLNLTYCTVTLKTDGPVSFEHAAETEWKSHPCYTEFKLEAYLAVAIHVGGKPYGTLNFSSPEPRKLSFTDTDREILKLMAQWVGSELERRQAEDALRASEASLAYAQHMAHIGNWERNIVTNEVRWSKEVYRIFGLNPQQSDPTFAVFLNAVHPDDRQNVIDTVNKAISEKQPYHNDFRVVQPDGTERIVNSEAEITFDKNGKAVYLFGTIQDITEHRQVQERLRYLAYYDSLTGLPNRQQVNDSLYRAMLEAESRERLVAVMFLDLDRFKNINDTLGHDVGDALLKEVAVRLKASLRPGDSISRLGGDEFILILGNIAHINDVTRVAQKILDQFIPPFRIAGRDLFISPSVGITLYPFDDNNPENLLKNADIAMYRAKELGRNNFQFYTPELNVRAARRLELETGLRRALEKEEFILHYQPLVNMQTGKIAGMEALLRWQHPEYGLIPPMDFIPLAEETGLIVPIGEWVLRTACAQIKTWHATGFPAMHVAVNLSSVQLQQKNFAETVKRALREIGLEPQYLDLELTESLLMHDMEAVEKILKELKALGVLFSLDDFGTGYSSLSYLKRFPIDFLKIDRSFVNDINQDRYGAGIVRAIIVMAHTLGIKVIAEGVETAEQLEFLRAQGCDITQGYFCSEPLAVETFTELLKDWQDIRMGKCSINKPVRKLRKKQIRHPRRLRP